jgi:hypothetical protein
VTLDYFLIDDILKGAPNGVPFFCAFFTGFLGTFWPFEDFSKAENMLPENLFCSQKQTTSFRKVFFALESL